MPSFNMSLQQEPTEHRSLKAAVRMLKSVLSWHTILNTNVRIMYIMLNEMFIRLRTFERMYCIETDPSRSKHTEAGPSLPQRTKTI